MNPGTAGTSCLEQGIEVVAHESFLHCAVSVVMPKSKWISPATLAMIFLGQSLELSAVMLVTLQLFQGRLSDLSSARLSIYDDHRWHLGG